MFESGRVPCPFVAAWSVGAVNLVDSPKILLLVAYLTPVHEAVCRCMHASRGAQVHVAVSRRGLVLGELLG